MIAPAGSTLHGAEYPLRNGAGFQEKSKDSAGSHVEATVRARLGQFSIDSETRQLLSGVTDVHLSPKAFDLLCTLIQCRPRVLGKVELHARIWPDTHVVDANLNILIGEIRRALGDSAQRQAFIRTVHGVGYAFCGPVDVRATAAATEPLCCWVVWRNRTFPLSEGDNIIGRDPRCAVWVEAAGVSRRHARIRVESVNRRVALEDLDSTNGTFVRRSPVDGEVLLADGDVVQVGTVQLTVHLWATDKAPETKRIRRRNS
jgi:DNA-binding winged helix-turn-helix (wHTH) protein